MAILLRRAWQGLNHGLRSRIEHLEITPNHFTALRWLSENEPRGLSQRQLADLMAIDANTMSSTLSRMEQRGLIRRTSNPKDLRASRVSLTVAGREALESAKPIALAYQNRVLDALPAGRRDLFLEELEAIAAACGALLEETENTNAPSQKSAAPEVHLAQVAD